MHVFKVMLSAALFFTFTSCEHQAMLTYKVHNSTSAPLRVVTTNTNGRDTTTTISIPAHEQATIAIIAQGLSGVRNYKETGDSLHELTGIDVFRNDTVMAKTSFLNTSRWHYHQNNAHSADYTSTVTDADF